MGWFEVDKEGLARILRRRGIEFVVWELVANAWDSKAVSVDITLEPVPNKRLARLVVEDDDPDGFADLRDSFTMFVDSKRRNDPEKSGRFSLGEKLVLAVAEEATVSSTTGTIRFDKDGRHRSRDVRAKGSRVDVVFPCTRDELAGIIAKVPLLIPPFCTTFNGTVLEHSPCTWLTEFEATLDTVLPDEEGILRHRPRKTKVRVYEDEVGWLYELGIPVVETGDTYSYNVLQKVPLSLDRDNVPPRYLRTLRVFAFNALHEKTTSEDCSSTWVRDALADERVDTAAVKTAVERRFGGKVVAYDPSDTEANAKAVAQGYTVVHGRQLSSAEWANVKKAGVILPAGRVTPSSHIEFSNDPNAEPLKLIPPEKYTSGMWKVVNYAKLLAEALIGKSIVVKIASDITLPCGACYGQGELLFNAGRLGKAWFEDGINDKVVALCLHEIAHDVEKNHLSERFADTIAEFGAKMRRLGHLESEV